MSGEGSRRDGSDPAQVRRGRESWSEASREAEAGAGAGRERPGAGPCSGLHPTLLRRSWSSARSCCRPVSPAPRMTAWTGETGGASVRPSASWETQATASLPTHRRSIARSPGESRACGQGVPGTTLSPHSSLQRLLRPFHCPVQPFPAPLPPSRASPPGAGREGDLGKTLGTRGPRGGWWWGTIKCSIHTEPSCPWSSPSPGEVILGDTVSRKRPPAASPMGNSSHAWGMIT